MGQTFVSGLRIPVTKIGFGAVEVKAVKTQDKHGYWALQVKSGRNLKEIRFEEAPAEKIGDQLKASEIFAVGDKVAVTGISKGKGFAGGVKRWHFKGGPKTHGQSNRQRAPGSIGTTTTPGRVLKGKHMAGRMGGDKVTFKNLHVVSVNPEGSEITVSGPVPGRFGSLLLIKKLGTGSLTDLTKKGTVTVVEGEAAKTAVKEAPKNE